MTVVELLVAAYRAHGIVSPTMLESYLAGTNLLADVSEVVLSENELFVIYVRDGGHPGKHGAPVDENPESLGIVLDGRHAEVFEVVEPFEVVRCIAADFERGKVPDVGGQGGGVRYILPPEWRTSARRVR